MDRKTIKISILIACTFVLLTITSCTRDKEVLSLPKDCIEAGQVSPDNNIACCSGLFRIFVAEYAPTRSCVELSEHSVADGSVYYICSACGNKTCESWENRCNCPQDCKFP